MNLSFSTGVSNSTLLPSVYDALESLYAGSLYPQVETHYIAQVMPSADTAILVAQRAPQLVADITIDDRFIVIDYGRSFTDIDAANDARDICNAASLEAGHPADFIVVTL